MLKTVFYLLVLLQRVCLAKENKRILLNDPALMEQRLSHLEQRIQTVESENRLLKDRLNQYEAAQIGEKSSIYTLWGRKHCPSNISEEIYSGYAAGGWYNDKGSPTNYLCLPSDPTSSGKTAPDSNNRVYGVEYETDFWGPHSSDEDAPCAVCSATSGSNILMIPGRDTCYSGWTKQYNGYLGTSYYGHIGAKEYVCVDQNPEYLNGGERGTDGALFYPVIYQCGALQCPPYIGNEAVNCVVCSK